MDHCSVACNLLTMHTEGHIRGKLIRKADFSHNPFAMQKLLYKTGPDSK